MNRFLEWARELRALSTDGLAYCKSAFDIERFERIREISAEMTAYIGSEPLEKVSGLFRDNDGYQTPKVGTRAAIFNDQDEVLLVKDFDGKWVMPGGWCEYNLSIMESTAKEALEEAGLIVRPYRIVSLYNHRKRFSPNSFFDVLDICILCEVISGHFEPNSETTESGYFPLDALPELNTHKTDRLLIETCLQAKKAVHWEPVTD